MKYESLQNGGSYSVFYKLLKDEGWVGRECVQRRGQISTVDVEQ